MEKDLKMVVRPSIFKPYEQVSAGQSTRHGGISPAPYNSLNLGKSTDDAPENVAENRRRLAATMGFPVTQMAWSRQVHGDMIRLVTSPSGAEGFDALVTNVPGILLAVSVADCTPILVYDREHSAVAAIHAGWKGTVAQIVLKTLNFMAKTYGTRGPDCVAFIGACIDECSFEVGLDVAAEFADVFKRFDPERQKYLVDLKKANAAQCQMFGIPEEQVEISRFSTVIHHEDYFSHRKEKGVTGRGMGVIGMYA